MNDPSDFEFDRDREALDAALEQIEGWDGEAVRSDNMEAKIAASELIAEFFGKHWQRLEADGIPAAAYLRDFTAKRESIKAARLRADDMLEKLLHSGANLAECRAQLIEHEYRLLKNWEKWTEADWNKLTTDQQKQLREVLSSLRETMPDMLASLPIEKRRELEGIE